MSRHALLPLLLAACESGPVSLIDHDLWTEAAWDEDPVGDLPDCQRATWDVLYDYVDIETKNESEVVDTCSWQLLTQPLPVRLRPGDTVELMGWHTMLEKPLEDSEAHYAIYAGSEPLFDFAIELPTIDEVYRETVTIENAVPRGTPLYWHVHNHGDNSYALRVLTLL